MGKKTEALRGDVQRWYRALAAESNPAFLPLYFDRHRYLVLCGGALAAATFVKVILIDRLLLANDTVTLTVALAVAVTIAFTVLCAKIVGVSLPMIANKLGLDPAVMASPFITTIVDALSLLLYFAVARTLLHI